MIIAVDFDGILCHDAFPKIGAPRYEIISLVRRLIDRGHEVILWTTRNGNELTAAVDWCGERGLHFCNVNGPAPSNEKEYRGKYPTQSRKIFADVYIDDHSIEYMMGENASMRLTRYLQKGVNEWPIKED